MAKVTSIAAARRVKDLSELLTLCNMAEKLAMATLYGDELNARLTRLNALRNDAEDQLDQAKDELHG